MEKVSVHPIVWSRDSGATEKRNVWTALKRGLRGRCPRCGEGKLFRAFLKVDDHCPVCGLDYTPHRADDLPAYLVIVIVGHIVVPLVLMIETNYSPPVRPAAGDLFAVDADFVTAVAATGEGRRGRGAMGAAHAWIRRAKSDRIIGTISPTGNERATGAK